MKKSWFIKCLLRNEKARSAKLWEHNGDTFSLLEMILRSNWKEISEIPPRPPLTKGGWGDFFGIHPHGNIFFLVPAGPA
jgi:hypothetical protein